MNFNNVVTPIVSIFIFVRKRWNSTLECLNFIWENTTDIPYDVIIVTCDSTDKTPQIIEQADNVRIVNHSVGKRHLIPYNLVSEYAKGRYTIFLSNKSRVQKGWLKPLFDIMENDETIGMVGPKLIYPDGSLLAAGGIMWSDGSVTNYGKGDVPSKPDYNYVKEVDYLSGECLMIRNSIWVNLGGFDHHYASGFYSIADFSFSLRKYGYKVTYQPQSMVVRYKRIQNGVHNEKDRERFLEKWKETLLADKHTQAEEDMFWANDRSRNKKTIVVVYEDGLEFDKSTASRMIFHYVKLFVSMGLHVIFIGDNYMRQDPYTTVMEQMGIKVLYGEWYKNNFKQWLITNAKYIDFAYLIYPFIARKYIKYFRKHSNATIIYNASDLFYLRDLRNYEVTKEPWLLEMSKWWKKVEFNLFKKTDVVHLVSCFEQEIVQSKFPQKRVRHIPVYIYEDANRLKDLPAFEERHGLLFVGQFGHKPNPDGVLWFIRSIFPEILESLPDIIFYIVGLNPPEEIMEIRSNHIIVTGHVSDEELESYYRTCRLVVAPLRFGAGVKGKVVEAMYHQVPLVTTSNGAEGLREIENFIKIADQEDDFAQQVIALYNSKEEWERLSIRSRGYIENYFSVTSARKLLDQDIY